MKIQLVTVFSSLFFLIAQSSAFADAAHPTGEITIYNASKNPVTAQLSSYGSFTLASQEQRTIAYSSLSRVCSSTPTNCRADFFVNNVHAGSAAINVLTGKLVAMHLGLKVSIQKVAQIVRSVTIR